MVDIQAVDSGLVGMGSLLEGNSEIDLRYMLEVVPVVVRYMAVPPVEVGKCILVEI